MTLENKILKLTVESTRFPGPHLVCEKARIKGSKGKNETSETGEGAEEDNMAGSKDRDLPLRSYDGGERPDADGEQRLR